MKVKKLSFLLVVILTVYLLSVLMSANASAELTCKEWDEMMIQENINLKRSYFLGRLKGGLTKAQFMRVDTADFYDYIDRYCRAYAKDTPVDAINLYAEEITGAATPT
jgi:hypothetical protein